MPKIDFKQLIVVAVVAAVVVATADKWLPLVRRIPVFGKLV